MIIGGHVSASGGYNKAVERAVAIGGNSLQIFSGSPRTWQIKDVTDDHVKSFRQSAIDNNIHYSCFHAVYLINLADTGDVGQKSVKTLMDELHLASRLGVDGSVVHTGSYKKEGRTDQKYHSLISNLQKVLSHTPDDTHIMLENSGNRKIGEKIEELAEIIKDINSPRLRVCLDTCHLHAAGYDLSTNKTYSEFMDMFEEKIGIDKIAVLHINDSRDERGSLRDRHENIGEGTIEMSVFKNIMQDGRLEDVPKILEVPGFDGNGPDEKNISIIKNL
jgi:deoxyribonuclease-4